MSIKSSFAKPFSLAVLISGNGSNLQAIMDAITRGDLAAQIAVVISDQADAYGLIRARNAGITTLVLSKKSFKTREEYDAQLRQDLDHFACDLVVLAGFMRILSNEFVRQFYGRLINIHPSLLPRYPGLHTHEQVLANGDVVHGVTIHLVNENLDAGPILAQQQIAVASDDNIESLKTKIHQIEHRLYPQVIDWFVKKRVRVDGNSTWLDEKLLKNPTDTCEKKISC